MDKKTEVDVKGMKNATEEERKIFLESAKEFEKVINRPGFWNIYIEREYNKWTYNNDMSYSEFYSLVMLGRDKFENKADYNIRVHVNFYYSWRNVIGYTYPSTWFTWINRKFFKNFDVPDIAGNIAHEYLHNCGLGHPGRDKNSVVYKFGDAVKRAVRVDRDWSDDPVVYKRSIWSRIKSFFARLF